MLRIDRNDKKLIKLEGRSLPEQGLMEAYDLQKMIRNSPDAFFKEMGEKLLLTAEWLTEMYGVDVRCHRLALSVQADMEFLSCTCIYPPPEISEHARKRGRRDSDKEAKWSDWDEALVKISNEAVVEFFRRELAAGRENHLAKRILHFRLDGRRRFFVCARRNSAYVWQYRRFPGDEKFWAEKIGPHLDAEPVKDGRALRFHLSTAKDFAEFLDAVNGHLQTVKFSEEETGDETENEA